MLYALRYSCLFSGNTNWNVKIIMNHYNGLQCMPFQFCDALYLCTRHSKFTMKLRLSFAVDLISCSQVADCVMKLYRFILLAVVSQILTSHIRQFTLPVF